MVNIYDQLKEKLQNTSLSENEIGVYLSLLKIGESTTGKILKEYKMSAGKIYYVLDKLIKKGLISYVTKNNIKNYKSQDPGNIIEYLEKEKQKIESKENDIKKLLPEITKALITDKDDISVEIYEGYEGFKTAVYKFMDEHEHSATEYEFDNFDANTNEQFPDYIKYVMLNYSKMMIEKNITAKMLLSTTNIKLINEAKQILNGTNYEIRYIKDQKFASILCSNKNTMIMDYTKPSVVYIKSKNIAQSFIKMFEALWTIAEDI